ncbi:MAG: hypothetical protein JW827_05730 [Spirochaetes bacterium]|nr:hypothetical protein [Spirochaetota bacterium]
MTSHYRLFKGNIDLVKKISICSFLLFLPCFLYTQHTPEKEILLTVKKFFHLLKVNNKNGMQNILCHNMKLDPMNNDDIIRLGEQMLNGDIPISEYIVKITGHNIYKFLHFYQLVNFEITEKVRSEVTIEEDRMKDNYFYVRVLIIYKDGGSEIKKKKCEINIIREKSRYKILGFIL